MAHHTFVILKQDGLQLPNLQIKVFETYVSNNMKKRTHYQLFFPN